MLTLNDARERLLSFAQPLCPSTQSESVPTLAALGRVLARDVISPLNVPSADNAQMDGFAVRVADCVAPGVVLPISQRIAAGQCPSPLTPGTAARIFTGAYLPQGADAVVMQENAHESLQDSQASVLIQHTPSLGEWIRRTGEDIGEGSVILRAGTRLSPQALGLAASVGMAALPVIRPLRVALFSTGDELVMPGKPLPAGTMYNSNRFVLHGLLHQLGCKVADLGIVPDDLTDTRATLRRASETHDVIITSGGVSVGEKDVVKPAVEAEGRLMLWKIAMKPGKPFAFGKVSKAFFMGLPGNPVSSFVTFLLLVRPFLLRLQGIPLAQLTPQTYAMRADFDWPATPDRQTFLRVKINAEGGLDVFPQQGSGVLSSVVWGDGLVDQPAGDVIKMGNSVRFLPWMSLML